VQSSLCRAQQSDKLDIKIEVSCPKIDKGNIILCCFRTQKCDLGAALSTSSRRRLDRLLPLHHGHSPPLNIWESTAIGSVDHRECNWERYEDQP
jgi:hypothetical protein